MIAHGGSCGVLCLGTAGCSRFVVNSVRRSPEHICLRFVGMRADAAPGGDKTHAGIECQCAAVFFVYSAAEAGVLLVWEFSQHLFLHQFQQLPPKASAPPAGQHEQSRQIRAVAVRQGCGKCGGLSIGGQQ